MGMVIAFVLPMSSSVLGSILNKIQSAKSGKLLYSVAYRLLQCVVTYHKMTLDGSSRL